MKRRQTACQILPGIPGTGIPAFVYLVVLLSMLGAGKALSCELQLTSISGPSRSAVSYNPFDFNEKQISYSLRINAIETSSSREYSEATSDPNSNVRPLNSESEVDRCRGTVSVRSFDGLFVSGSLRSLRFNMSADQEYRSSNRRDLTIDTGVLQQGETRDLNLLIKLPAQQLVKADWYETELEVFLNQHSSVPNGSEIYFPNLGDLNRLSVESNPVIVQAKSTVPFTLQLSSQNDGNLLSDNLSRDPIPYEIRLNGRTLSLDSAQQVNFAEALDLSAQSYPINISVASDQKYAAGQYSDTVTIAIFPSISNQ